MNEVVLFENKDFGNIRVLGDHLKPMFVAKDVAEALGYTNTNDAIQKFCKGVAKRYPLSNSWWKAILQWGGKTPPHLR